MIVFKCKMCGGEMELEEGATVAECPYCLTKQTLPKLDDDKRANMYDRANHFRRQNEYDKAMAIFENILQEDRTDAEAYWSLVLCRYGIEYVEDPATHKRVPTVNRVQYTSILADEDYKSALEYADFAQRGVYESEAKAIDEIQKGILAISKQEKPFDVFICYKETDANGRRTPDSVLANDLYHQLTNEGFKVFFSRITLEDKIGTAYEPYIFAALNSAKVMVVLGTKPEYFNAVWVKNEWSRYLALIRAGADKTLVPAYRDMDPYDLPEEFSHLQAQDMSKLGFMQDLIRGIKKIISKEEKPKSSNQQSTTGVTVESLMKRARLFLEDGDYKSANEYLDKVLDIDPEYAPAYVGKTQVAVEVPYESSLAVCLIEYEKDSDWKKAIRFASPEQRTIYEGYVTKAQETREEKRKNDIYQKALNYYQNAQLPDECYEARKLFMSIPGYRDSDRKQDECSKKAKDIEEQRARAAEAARKQQLEEEQKKKRESRNKAIAALALIAFVAFIVVYITVISPQIKFNNTFNKAKSQIESGEYGLALKTLDEIKDRPEIESFIESSSELQGELARIANYNVGNTVVFGNYEQDNSTSNGKEPIEWIVISEEDDRRLLVSKYVLDVQPFNTDETSAMKLYGSHLWTWLQNDFKNTAFNTQELSFVSSVLLLTDGSFTNSEDNKIRYYLIPEDKQAAQPTQYAKSKGSDGSWYLDGYNSGTSSGQHTYCKVIRASGSCDDYGTDLGILGRGAQPTENDEIHGVRPAIWVDISKPLP